MGVNRKVRALMVECWWQPAVRSPGSLGGGSPEKVWLEVPVEAVERDQHD